MSLFSCDTGRRDAFERRSTLAGSILFHLLLLVWLLTASYRPAGTQRDRAFRTFDLPLVVPDIVEPADPPAIAEPGEDVPAQDGGGKPAKALVTRPEVRPAPTYIPVPPIPLMLPDPVAIAVAPIAGPAPVVSGGEGSGTGAGAGTGEGAGSGKGAGAGSGERVGSGGVERQGASAGQLQMAEWIVRPSDDLMRSVFPRRAFLYSMSGNVRLSCRVDTKQRAQDCRVLHERPLGYGFATAAKQAVRAGLIKVPVNAELDPSKVRVLIVIAFDHSGTVRTASRSPG